MDAVTKPVGIFRHSPGEGAGYFATFLEANRIPYRLIRIDAGEPVPSDPHNFSGLCFMGGPMSVNDDLPWIPPVLGLIRDAVDQQVPVIGHCLGGQLMSKALGGEVRRNRVKEIGWGTVRRVPSDETSSWLGDVETFDAFHWHGETFSIPTGATRILESAFCANQAFVLGPHLGMQCHVEMTPAMIRLWAGAWKHEGASIGPSVQSPEEMQAAMESRIVAMRQIADRLYGHWITALDRHS